MSDTLVKANVYCKHFCQQTPQKSCKICHWIAQPSIRQLLTYYQKIKPLCPTPATFTIYRPTQMQTSRYITYITNVHR